jgi:hypothetical protein
LACEKLGNIKKATYYAEQALKIFEEIGSPNAEIVRQLLAWLKTQRQ